MHRATPANSSFRSYVAGGGRAAVLEVDDSKLMQEHKANYLYDEQAENIESPHQYGFTSVCMDADADQQGNITACAQTIVTFVGGNRTLGVAGPMEDRRHRLKDLNKGDVAMFRTKDDRQQLHMVKSDDYTGTYLSTRDDMTWRFALVPKPQQQQQQQQQQQSGANASSTPTSAAQQQQQQQYGQQNCLEDNKKSVMCFEETKDHHLLQHNKNTLEQKDDQQHFDHDQGHLIIKTDSITGYLEPNGNILFYINNDPTKSVLVAPDHVHILYKKFAFWVNKGGCFCSVRPVIAQDPDA
jgi:phage gp45-like